MNFQHSPDDPEAADAFVAVVHADVTVHWTVIRGQRAEATRLEKIPEPGQFSDNLSGQHSIDQRGCAAVWISYKGRVAAGFAMNSRMHSPRVASVIK